jgi:hypothetical protein
MRNNTYAYYKVIRLFTMFSCSRYKEFDSFECWHKRQICVQIGFVSISGVQHKSCHPISFISFDCTDGVAPRALSTSLGKLFNKITSATSLVQIGPFKAPRRKLKRCTMYALKHYIRARKTCMYGMPGRTPTWSEGKQTLGQNRK